MSKAELQPRSKDVLRMICSIIFFGTPHVRGRYNKNWHRLTHLLKFVGGLPPRFLAESEGEAKAAAVICDAFADSGLEMDVLSIYETRTTKVKLGRFPLLFKEAVPVIFLCHEIHLPVAC